MSVCKTRQQKNTTTKIKQDTKENKYHQIMNVHLQYMSYVWRYQQHLPFDPLAKAPADELQLCNSCSFIRIHWHLSSLEWDNWAKMVLQPCFCGNTFLNSLRNHFVLTSKHTVLLMNICRTTLVKWRWVAWIPPLGILDWWHYIQHIHLYMWDLIGNPGFCSTPCCFIRKSAQK